MHACPPLKESQLTHPHVVGWRPLLWQLETASAVDNCPDVCEHPLSHQAATAINSNHATSMHPLWSKSRVEDSKPGCSFLCSSPYAYSPKHRGKEKVPPLCQHTSPCNFTQSYTKGKGAKGDTTCRVNKNNANPQLPDNWHLVKIKGKLWIP